jgi:uncharacterized protein YndB with AHSA1/START domain
MKIPAEKMAQKTNNQKGTKHKAKANAKKGTGAKAAKKASPVLAHAKNVKKSPKLAPKKVSKPVTAKKAASKVQTSSANTKNKAVLATKGSKPSNNPGKQPVSSAKTSVSPVKKAVKTPEPLVVLTPEAIKKLPTIKRPGAGQVPQRKAAGGKAQKKVFRSEMIFPNQLKETPLTKPKNKPEPKGKFVLEFLVKSSPTLLFDFLATPSGLSEWFADDVDIRNEEFTFHWDGQIQRAKLLAYKQDHLLRLRWVDKNDDFYFEFRIDHDDLTGDVTLLITDFGESEDDLRTSKLLWESQVHKLMKVLGAY